MRALVKAAANRLAYPFGARLVGANWGPRGFANCFARIGSRGLEPKTIIDVGASDGCWSRECMGVFPHARYALFDALPENSAALQTLTDNNSNMMYWNGALGAQSGHLLINSHGDQTSFFHSADWPGTPLEVEVRPLDSFIESMSFKGPILIKADVQGYELEVLRGATRCLEMTEVLLLEVSFRQIYEASPLAHEVVSELGARGYRIYDICSYAQRSSDEELLQADIVFVHRESPLFQDEGWR